MKANIKDALKDAEKRLDDALANIEKRHKNSSEKKHDEPDHLRSGVELDEVEIKRLIKEQDSENSNQ